MSEKENESLLPEEKSTSDFQLVEAYTEAKASNGDAVSSDDFKFVQQDKKIHDVKFTTKPTTFFRDAMRRFAKNKSSVVGGIILGILFLLAIILPIDGVIPFDISLGTNSGSVNVLNYETNLPPKIFDTGTGFLDGTLKMTNQPYPIDQDGNYIGLGNSKDCVVSVSNTYEGYADVYSSDGVGGYATVSRGADTSAENTGTGFIYSLSYSYNFSETDYTLSFTLGWKQQEGYKQPDFDVLLYANSTFYPLTNYSLKYGEPGEKESNQATVTPFATQEVNLSELVRENEQIQEDFAGAATITGNIGFIFRADPDNSTALYIHDATLTSSNTANTTEQTQMGYRSFDDANALVGQPSSVNGRPNARYWATNSTDYNPTDVKTTRCDIVYDMYQVRYGLNQITIAQSTLNDWVSRGLITYTDGNPASYQKTEAGAATNEVYVESIVEDHGDALNANVIMWKYLGYDSMPKHILGTDSRGRDLLKYVFSGLRTSLILGIIVAAINVFIGVFWGSISGYFGGVADLVMERIVDILSGIPWIVLMTVLCLVWGQTFFIFALALCLTGWIGTESVTRSQFYRYKGREYVLASRTLGARAPRLIFRHILPNAIGTIITNSILMVPSVIFNEATISYLGLGLKGLDSLGVILSDNQNFLNQYPYQLIVPAVIISLLMICFNLFGNGLRDAFNPSLKGSE